MQGKKRELLMLEKTKLKLRDAHKRVLRSDMPDRFLIADEILVALDYIEHSTWIFVNGLYA